MRKLNREEVRERIEYLEKLQKQKFCSYREKNIQKLKRGKGKCQIKN